MANKNILFTAPYVTEIVDRKMPQADGDKVLVKLVRSSISAGTDRANLVGDPNVNTLKGPSVDFPRQGGYSASGIVCAVGNDVTTIRVGDRVACSWTKHSQYFALPESRVYKLDERVSFGAGALVHIATFPMAAIRKCKVEVGESAIVMGLGVLGMIALQLLRASGAVPIIAVDPIPQKREQALLLGADFALDPFDPNFIQKVRDITDGGAAAAIEVTGKGQGLDMVLDCVRPMARVALLGCTRNSDFSIDYYRKVHGTGVTLIGAHTQARPKLDSYNGCWTERDDALAILKLIAGGRVDLDSLIEEVHSPMCGPKVYERLANSPAFPVVQFDWSDFE